MNYEWNQWNLTKGYRIYRNLHDGTWTVLAWHKGKRGWRKYLSTRNLIADFCTFKVYESGRQRVLREGRKNVHAFICAEIATPYDLRYSPDRVEYSDAFNTASHAPMRRVRYSPHDGPHFTLDGERVVYAPTIIFDSCGCVWVGDGVETAGHLVAAQA